MKLAILPLAIALSVSSGLQAAQNSAAPQQPDLDALVTHLQLDETKAEQLKTIMQNHRQSKEKMGKRKDQARESRDQHEQKLLTVLDYEQLYKLKKYMRQHKNQSKRCAPKG
ncbi:MAG: hypothetical protein GY784_14190 [Gammaproteobacteria bacterium]|nr:hypothetical protein [Gammaproteobacteria bacterium]